MQGALLLQPSPHSAPLPYRLQCRATRLGSCSFCPWGVQQASWTEMKNMARCNVDKISVDAIAWFLWLMHNWWWCTSRLTLEGVLERGVTLEAAAFFPPLADGDLTTFLEPPLEDFLGEERLVVLCSTSDSSIMTCFIFSKSFSLGMEATCLVLPTVFFLIPMEPSWENGPICFASSIIFRYRPVEVP